jgi:acetylornithine/succinyldiaminopimelate/putrescine aminotransferase/pimeloyl-ACP methyl ester carboxylesterase/acyl carrier protein
MNASSLPPGATSLTVEDALRLLDGLNAAGAKPAADISLTLAQAGANGGRDTRGERCSLADRLSNDLRDLATKVLKTEPEDFSSSTPLMNYGLDSIAATEIGALFTEKFGITVPPTAFFEFQDINSFTNYLLVNYEVELRARYGAMPADLPSFVEFPHSPASIREPVPAAVAPSLEDLWKDSEEPATASKRIPAALHISTAPAALDAAAASPGTDEPSRLALQAAQPLVDAAHVLTIGRKGAPKLECAVYGDGPPVLLLGGLVMHYSVMWRLQLADLGARYRLIMVHLPGCGGADFYDGMSLDSLAGDVAGILDALGITTPVPVAGYSFGGVLAQAFCLAFPQRCSALCVTVSSPLFEGASDFRRLMGELQKSPRFMEINRGWSIPSLPAYQKAIETFDFRPVLTRLRIPALIVSGGDDTYMKPSYSRMIADRIEGARLVEFAGAGHLLGFTHYREYNQLLLEFFAGADGARPTRGCSTFLPAAPEALTLLEEYVANGEQGHCAILAAPAAQAAFLLNLVCNESKTEPADYRSYFLTSLEEAFDAALRLSRHHARNRDPASSGTLLIIDREGRWMRYFDPLARGPREALVPGIRVVADLAEAEKLLDGDLRDGLAAVALAVDGGHSLADVEHFLALLEGRQDALSILVEGGDPRRSIDQWRIRELSRHFDLVVLGEGLAGFQVPVGACLVNQSVRNPWLMTPNESYVRHVMTNFGFGLKVASEFLEDCLGASMLPSQRNRLRRIAASPAQTYEAHLQFGNSGYARVARLHGFDARFYEARGVRSRLTLDGRESRGIIDCFVNVGTCPRGLNPLDVIEKVARAHDPAHDYWADLQGFIGVKTGFAHVLPASSNVTAVEAALTLGLTAASHRRKLLCLTGGLGFTLLSAASSFDTVFDIFRKPFLPIHENTVFIDPCAAGAEEKLETELRGGEVALVWFETIQVDANASRPLPPQFIEIINRCRSEGGYLVGVDETQTNLVTGKLLHSQGLVEAPDIVALGTALCDSLLPMGMILATNAVAEAARKAVPQRLRELQSRPVHQLSAHIALNSLHDIYGRDLMAAARSTGALFKHALSELAQEYPLIREVRGEGLLLTVELDLAGNGAFIERSFGYLLWGAMLRDPLQGVAVAVCPIHNNCIRFLAPLTITPDETVLIVANLRRALTAGVSGVIRDCANYCLSRGDERTAAFLASLDTGTTASAPQGIA